MLKYKARLSGQPTWKRPGGMPRALWLLLAARGVESSEEAERFLHPSTRDLLAPETLHDMDSAVARIKLAQERGETVCVWGDYDVDGVSATAILLGALKHLGLRTKYHIPSRHQEGYGLNEQGVLREAQDARLLITVDCGVNAAAQVALAKAHGMDVIVTDHHRPGDALPDCPVVNPLLGSYQNPDLCGAGVAFKLAIALCPAYAMAFIDLAALATVADVVKLRGENRAIVSLGLERINQTTRPGLKALMRVAGISGSVSAGQLAFQLAPRLNAGGRLGSAERSLRLLMSATDEEAVPMASELDAENTHRKGEESLILREAEALLCTYDFVESRVIVLAGENWNPGVVGLAASRMVEKYHLPTVLLSIDGETATGSCRSIPGVDIFESLTAVGELLLRYGGHKQAAGLTLEIKRLDTFRARLNEAIIKASDPDCFVPCAEYDLAVSLDEVDLALAEALEALSPTGFGNPAPVLLAEGRVEGARGVGRDGAHLSLTFSKDDTSLRGIWFSHGKSADALDEAQQTALFSPRVDRYMNRVSVQIEVKAMRPSTLASALERPDGEGERLLHAFLTQALYNDKLSDVGAKDQAQVWDDAALEGWLKGSARGTLVAAADERLAIELLSRLDAAGLGERLDVRVGHYPDDPRAFNALCLFPVGEEPTGYGRILCLGAPSELFGLRAPAAGVAEWLSELPDVDQLRRLYQAVRQITKRPYAGRSALALARELSDLSGLDAVGAHAGLYALEELQLIDFSPDPLSVSMRPVMKADPMSAKIFRRMTKLRTWGGGLL